MPVHNAEIAEAFDELADLLEIENANPFRVRAYRDAARVIAGHPRAMTDLVAENADLTKLPHVGAALAQKIHELVKTGELTALEKARRRTPGALSILMNIRGLGPARVRALYHELKIRSIADLERAAKNGRIRALRGFGAKTEANILAQLERVARTERRFKRNVAEDIAEPLVVYLKKSRGAKRVTVAGSYRRRKDTVGDLDIVVTATRDASVMNRLARYDEVAEVLAKGKTRATVRLRSGLQVDVRVVPEVSYGAALYYFTGSKDHNIAVRTLGVRKRLKINEYGVFRGDERVAGRSEAEVFEQVGLDYIEPELRENTGEIEAAARHRLPELVTVKDIRGDLHCHTDATDGTNTAREMALAATERGYEYLAISDHSRRVAVARGLDAKRLAAQCDEIDRLNDELENITVLKSCEVDILENGSLDLPDKVLRRLDLVLAAVHYRFNLRRKRQTERILRAMDGPCFNVLVHPTGRLINERPGYEVDLEAVMRGAAARGCFLEVNAQPDRLDLTDEACRMAKDLGVKVAIATDAHNTHTLDYMRYGVDQARRGWLTKDDVINTRSLPELRELLQRG
jgi:DNA polymerase (family 10)